MSQKQNVGKSSDNRRDDIRAEIDPPIGALMEELSQIRQEMAQQETDYLGRCKERTRILWSEEQDELLRKNLAKPNAEIARMVSAVGAKRSPAAVKTRRLRIEAAKPPIVPRKANEWPVVNGDWEQQSERFRVRLLEEMLKEVRSRRA